MEAHIKTLQLQTWLPPKSSAHHVVASINTNEKENMFNQRESTSVSSSISLVAEPIKSTSIAVTKNDASAHGENVHKSSKSKTNKGSITTVHTLKPSNNITRAGPSVSHYSSVPASIWVNNNDFPV